MGESILWLAGNIAILWLPAGVISTIIKSFLQPWMTVREFKEGIWSGWLSVLDLIIVIGERIEKRFSNVE